MFYYSEEKKTQTSNVSPGDMLTNSQKASVLWRNLNRVLKSVSKTLLISDTDTHCPTSYIPTEYTQEYKAVKKTEVTLFM